jgi:hypothetical protein
MKEYKVIFAIILIDDSNFLHKGFDIYEHRRKTKSNRGIKQNS